jgi:hypothetical protein
MKIPLERRFPQRDFKDAREWHTYHVFNDPDFIEKFDEVFLDKKTKKTRGITEVNISTINKLAEEFGIEISALFYYTGVPSRHGGGLSKSGGGIQYDERTDSFLYKVSPDVTREELVALWKKQQEQITSKGFKRHKRKPPENPRLLYAVFKARSRSPAWTFKAIYQYYADGKLPYYEGGNTKQFKSEDALETYYHKNEPRTWLKTTA